MADWLGADVAKGTCTVSGCGKDEHCKGLCPMHYQRLRRFGSLEKPPPRESPEYPPCSMEGCPRPGKWRRMCESHYRAQWHAEHRAESYAKAVERRSVNRDQYLAEGRAYYRSNRDRILSRMSEDYAANAAERKARTAAWRRANPIKVREYELRRRARKRATQTEPVDYVAILAEYGMFCHICSLVIVDETDLHFDHVVALAAGGTHTRDNIKPAHALCNTRKGHRTS